MSKNTVEVVNGVRRIYGPVVVDSTLGTKGVKAGANSTLELEFEASDLPLSYGLTQASVSGAYASIPAGSFVVSAYLFVLEEFTGGTSLAIGLDRKDNGTAIDTDGFITDAEAITTNLGDNAVVVGAGALIGSSVGDNDGVVVVEDTGSYSAGKARLVVEYIAAGADI